MQLSKIFLTSFMVAAATAAAVQPPGASLCTTMAAAGLTNLDQLGCAAFAIANVPVSPGLKDDLCLALYHGGLLNLDKVGCAPTEQVLHPDRDDKHEGSNAETLPPRDRSLGGTMHKRLLGAPDCSSARLCSLDQLSLIDAQILGCVAPSKRDGAPVEARAGDGSGCRQQLCKLGQKSLLLSLTILGCAP
ncbi:hypothetical protein OC835_002764 [Tilletia horrida]|nr:hypothetical protein OC835_002764 [Tilletia horrida]